VDVRVGVDHCPLSLPLETEDSADLRGELKACP
jgi:hypothetical protein